MGQLKLAHLSLAAMTPHDVDPQHILPTCLLVFYAPGYWPWSCFSNVPRMFPSQGLSFVWTLVSCPFGLLPYFIIVFVQISSPWKHLHCALDLSRALLSRSQPFVFSLLYFFFVTLTTIFIQSIYRHIFLLSVSFIWNIRFMRIEILSGALRITIVLPIPRHSLNYVLVWNRLVFWHFGFFSSPLKFSSYAFTLQKQFPF